MLRFIKGQKSCCYDLRIAFVAFWFSEKLEDFFFSPASQIGINYVIF